MLRVDKDKDDGQEILAELLEEDDCRTEIILALLCERVDMGKYNDIKFIVHLCERMPNVCSENA
jgi:hypothetical protein